MVIAERNSYSCTRAEASGLFVDGDTVKIPVESRAVSTVVLA
jgi:hypothetical protein